MKADFRFNVRIDGFNTMVALDSEGIKDLDLEVVRVISKVFTETQTKINAALAKLAGNRQMPAAEDNPVAVEDTMEEPFMETEAANDSEG